MTERDWPTTLSPLILLAVSLAGAILLTTLAPHLYPPSDAWWFVPLAAVVGVGRWLLGGLPPRAGAARATFWALTAVQLPLVLINPVFGLVAFLGYVDSARQLSGREAWAGIGATAVVCAIAQTGGVASPIFTPLVLALFLAINLAIAGSMARLDRTRQERAEEIERTNAELVAAQERNAELQAELMARARDTGVTEERARLAREIHDTVAQDLVGIIAQLGAIAEVGDDAERERRLEVVDDAARRALAEVRRSVRALSSPRLDEADLPTAIGDLLTAWRQADGGEARLIVDGTPRASANDPAALRITQEALSNARKHAHARTVQVELGYEEDHVRVTIADDGAGFDAAAPRPGVGLSGMRGRAEQASGELAVDSEPGRGTIVTATLPGRWQ